MRRRDSGPLVPLCENILSFTKTDVYNTLRRRLVVRGGPSHGHNNMYKKFGEIWPLDF